MNEIDGRLVSGLVVLAAIADTRGFGRAAERLSMTQSGVSRAIAKLEARLNARLVHRTSRAVELTDEGRALYERVAQHLAGFGEAAAETSHGNRWFAVLGGLVGIAASIALGIGLYVGGLKLNLGRFFRVTGVFLVLIAAGLVTGALRTAHEAGWVTIG